MSHDDYATHSAFSDPGPHAALLAAVPTDPASLHAAVTAAVVHYRAGANPPTPEQLADVDGRWVETILDAVSRRAPGRALAEPRDPARQVGGCCRDHALLAVAILREHGVPARTRLGFAGYFDEGFRTDHVVAERWVPHDLVPDDAMPGDVVPGDVVPDDAASGARTRAPGRWARFDPELPAGSRAFDVHDLPTGEGSPFETAAEAWLAYRAGRTDLAAYGVAPNLPELGGPAIVHRYVLGDLAHRMRSELLLWDAWGTSRLFRSPVDPRDAELADRVARLVVRADAGDLAAERELEALWAADDVRVRPGPVVTTWSPTGRLGSTDLTRRTTTWHVPPGTGTADLHLRG
ncbi:transglutaminase-like domain-containing protein [Cellulosimicrobium sp. PMB13]|uniref:transglutaminase-like domain-containing protein n=1 Tax=Cellulosimicrobium sp. PMB13 TaxID=3120158 RepID=UPI003F4C9552